MTSTGINTSSILVFGNVLMGLLEREKPEYLVVVFDTPEPTFRHKAYADYKAGRDAMPDDLAVAIPRIHDLVDALQLATLQAPGWEADDLAATLAHQAEAEGIDTYLVTSDKDYEQLVTDRTRVCRPGGSGEQCQVLGVEEVLEKWQIERVEQVVDILALMGDKVDNVPGISGIGEKTAQKRSNHWHGRELARLHRGAQGQAEGAGRDPCGRCAHVQGADHSASSGARGVCLGGPARAAARLGEDKGAVR